MRVHGALIEANGVGVLITGPSGVGKSECALELVVRGHRFVADDAVDLVLEAGRPVGRSAPAVRDHLEIRGIGILCVSDLYGADAVAESTEVALVCRIEPDPGPPDRTGLDRGEELLLGVPVPRVAFSARARAGATLATLVDAAARDAARRRSGAHGAERFDARLRQLTGGA